MKLELLASETINPVSCLLGGADDEDIFAVLSAFPTLGLKFGKTGDA